MCHEGLSKRFTGGNNPGLIGASQGSQSNKHRAGSLRFDNDAQVQADCGLIISDTANFWNPYVLTYAPRRDDISDLPLHNIVLPALVSSCVDRKNLCAI